MWTAVGRPEYLRQQAELSLRQLGVERIDLFQLHRIDPDVPVEDQVGELKELQDEGKIRHIGLSEVTVDELRGGPEDRRRSRRCRTCYNLADRASEACSTTAREHGIGFIPWFPLATGELSPGRRPAGRGRARSTTPPPSQLALAWLLQRSPVMLPIPGTSSGRAPRGEHRGRRASS